MTMDDFKDADNPYRTPHTIEQSDFGQTATDVETKTEDHWREGPYLIVRRRGSKLPDCCPVCGESAEQPALKYKVREKMSPVTMVLLLLVLGPFILLLVASMAKEFRFAASFCDVHRRKEIIRRNIVRTLLIAGLGMLLLPFFVFDATSLLTVVAITSGVPTILVAAAYGLFRKKELTVVRCDQSFAWLTPVHPRMLDRVPEISAVS